jgi:hypothetical protein
MIQLRGRGEVELVSGDFTMVPVLDKERGPGEKVVMNLQRRASILEEEIHRLLASRS